MRYAPTPPPEEYDAEHIRSQLRQIAEIYNSIIGQLNEIENVAPTRNPDEPEFRVADGTNWNPGYGKGVYVYLDSEWHLLTMTNPPNVKSLMRVRRYYGETVAGRTLST